MAATTEQISKLREKLAADNAKLMQIQLHEPNADGQEIDPHEAAVKLFPSLAGVPPEKRESDEAYPKILEGIKDFYMLMANSRAPAAWMETIKPLLSDSRAEQAQRTFY